MHPAFGLCIHIFVYIFGLSGVRSAAGKAPAVRPPGLQLGALCEGRGALARPPSNQHAVGLGLRLHP